MVGELYQLEIEWPFYLSMRGFCQKVLAQFDTVLGTDYRKRYGGRKVALDELYSRIGKVAEFHDLVVIVITGEDPFQGPTTPAERYKLQATLDRFQEVTKVYVVFQDA